MWVLYFLVTEENIFFIHFFIFLYFLSEQFMKWHRLIGFENWIETTILIALHSFTFHQLYVNVGKHLMQESWPSQSRLSIPPCFNSETSHNAAKKWQFQPIRAILRIANGHLLWRPSILQWVSANESSSFNCKWLPTMDATIFGASNCKMLYCFWGALLNMAQVLHQLLTVDSDQSRFCSDLSMIVTHC